MALRLVVGRGYRDIEVEAVEPGGALLYRDYDKVFAQRFGGGSVSCLRIRPN